MRRRGAAARRTRYSCRTARAWRSCLPPPSTSGPSSWAPAAPTWRPAAAAPTCRRRPARSRAATCGSARGAALYPGRGGCRTWGTAWTGSGSRGGGSLPARLRPASPARLLRPALPCVAAASPACLHCCCPALRCCCPACLLRPALLPCLACHGKGALLPRPCLPHLIIPSSLLPCAPQLLAHLAPHGGQDGAECVLHGSHHPPLLAADCAGAGRRRQGAMRGPARAGRQEKGLGRVHPSASLGGRRRPPRVAPGPPCFFSRQLGPLSSSWASPPGVWPAPGFLPSPCAAASHLPLLNHCLLAAPALPLPARRLLRSSTLLHL